MNQKNKTQSFCPHFNVCSGCRIDANEPLPPLWEEVLSYFKTKNITITFKSDSRTKWRHRAKLAVRASYEIPLIGLFKERSHEVLPIPFCEIHHPQINLAVEFVEAWIKENCIQPYNETTGKGDLRYLQFVVERGSGRVQATFVLNCKNSNSAFVVKLKALIGQIQEKNPTFWHSIWINFNDKPTNSIFSDSWLCCSGEPVLWEKFNDTLIAYHPAGFAQANLDLFEKVLIRIHSLVESNKKIAEYYAGVGVIGLSLASKSAGVCCAEINENAEACFNLSKERLPIEVRDKITFQTGSAVDLLSILDEAEVVVVDPPRKGLDYFLLEALKEPRSALKQIIYLSCGWDSFMRDCDLLLQSGWKLVDAEGYLFFPGTNQIEILANFKRE